MFPSPALSTDLFPYSVTKCSNELCPCGNKSTEFGEEFDHEFSEENDGYDKSRNCSGVLRNESTTKLSLWETILQESEEKSTLLYKWQRKYQQSESEWESDHNSPVKYLNDKLFPILLPTMERMLIEACRWNALENQKCLFNGVDYLAQNLWNKNPQYPERSTTSLQLFDIPPFKLWLEKFPRPIYPKSWLWTKEQAAVYIQRYVRGWLIRKRDDVQELRLFWKALAAERIENNIESVQSSDESITASIILKPEKIEELNACDRYKFLATFCTNAYEKM